MTKKEMNQILSASGVHVSTGNIKVGTIPNFSLVPGVSCSREACKTCHVSGCYAMKSYRQYPAVRAAWEDNTEKALFDLDGLRDALRAYFQTAKPDFFRVHVGGDFITREYCIMWAELAREFPETRFLAFTKQWENVRGIDFPANFALVLSAWEGVTIPADLSERFPIAYCINHGDAIPEKATICPGRCDTCGACWGLHKTGFNVAFYKH